MIQKPINNIIAVSFLFIMACGQAGNKNNKATELNVYNWTNLIPDSIVRVFEKTYNVHVNYSSYSSNEELFAKIQSYPEQYDVIFPSDYMIDIMRKRDLLMKINWNNVPNFKNIDTKFLQAFYDSLNIFSVPFQWSTVGIGINTQKVTNAEPSWNILFDSKYKGRITMLDDIRYGIAPALIKLNYSVNTKDTSQLKEAEELMIKQKPLVKAYSSDTYIDLLKSGESWIAYGYSIDILQAARENPAFSYLIPKEGTTMGVECMCIPRGSLHKDLAEKFINFILEPKIHATISNYSLATNPNKAAIPFMSTGIKENKNIFPDSTILNKLVYLHDVGETTPFYDKVWNTIKNH